MNLKYAEVIIFTAIGLMILTALSALVNRAAMGGNGDFAIFNLKRTRAGSVGQIHRPHKKIDTPLISLTPDLAL